MSYNYSMAVEFEDNQTSTSNIKRPLYMGAQFGFSKPKMVNLLVSAKLVKNEEGATKLLLGIAVFFFLASFVIFWINAGGLDSFKKAPERTHIPIINRNIKN